jgi:hypothetical protein
MSGFGGHECHGDGFRVAHFSDKYNVGVFSEHGPQSVDERCDVSSDLSLRDQRMLLLIDILDGVFDGNDSTGIVFADVVDEGCDGGGFSGSGCSGYEHEALTAGGDVLPDIIGKSDFFYLWNIERECTDGCAYSVVFLKDIDAELEGADPIGAVDAVPALESLEVFVAEDGVDELSGDIGRNGQAFDGRRAARRF